MIDLAKAALLVENHFLAAAIGRIALEPSDIDAPFATDGCYMGYGTDCLLRDFAANAQPPVHDFMHAVVHCLFLHPYVGSTIGRRHWNLACDISAERVVAEVLGPRPGARGAAIAQIVLRVQRDMHGRADAERLYRHLREGRWSDNIPEWESLMRSDSHEFWYASEDARDGGAGEGIGAGKGQAASGQTQSNRKKLGGAPSGGRASGSSRERQKDEWRTVANSLAVQLQTLSSRRGGQLPGLLDDLVTASSERVDYAEFLRRFATPGEVMRLSDSEFDQVFYVYGLQLYRNMPLIEPLEYREERRIREFAIVIDTSGSVRGHAVRSFVSATFGILKESESFFDHIKVHILQCDVQVHSDIVITNSEELSRWSADFRIRGGGGTDFRPALSYIDEMVESGAFHDLGGVIYFTDGWGTYPEYVPMYPCVFAFYDDDHRPEAVPPWAIQVVLNDGVLKDLNQNNGAA